jgi:hypothetical protein
VGLFTAYCRFVEQLLNVAQGVVFEDLLLLFVCPDGTVFFGWSLLR